MQNQYTLHLDEFILNDYIPALFDEGVVHFINDDKGLLDNSYEIALAPNETPQQAVDSIIKDCIAKGIMTTADLDEALHCDYAILEDSSYDECLVLNLEYFGNCVRGSSTEVIYTA